MTAMRSESDAPPRASIRSDSYEAATIVQRSEARVLRDGAGAGRLHLLIHAPGAGAQHVKLTDAGVLGRDAAGIRNEIAVSSSYVSLRHARFSSIGEGWQVEDLRSVNGVRHNGIALQPGAAALLRPGDRVMCADVLVEVVAVAVNSADAAPASAA
jgi:pSer/pThr/pTyr-binding forkhead associated (FHA) protein